MTLTTVTPPSAAASPTPSAPVAPSRRTVVRSNMRAEWTKLRTVRSTVWTLGITIVIMIGLGVLFTALEVARWDQRSIKDIATFDPLLYSFAGINLAQLSVGVLGVLVMTSEYTSGLMTETLTATPQRKLLLAAKVATFTAVIGVVGLFACFASFLTGQAILGPTHGGVSLTDPSVLRAVLGAALFLVMIGVIAIGVGAAIRRTAGAVAILFAVLLVLPGLVMLLPSPWNDEVTKYLPGAAGEAMAAVTTFPNILGPLAGLLVMCAYTVAALTIGALALTRRDG
jgi:ABC-type transport system involved in multi-copper enzyme maturation permease subunit